MTVLRYRLFETVIGTCGIAWSERGLCRLQLPESSRRMTEKRLARHATNGAAEAAPSVPPLIDQLITDLQRYFSGSRVEFDSVAIDLHEMAPFEQQVYAAARAIPWGRTVSYGELARRIGSPEAARAVGQALGHNPVPVIIPCHRVLAKGHRIGGFSAHGGIRTKKRLLALEGVNVDVGTPLLPGFV